MNAFGADVRGLDVDGFLTTMRQLFPVLAVAWLALLLRVRRDWWLLLGVVLANGYVWFVTNWPLQRLYALGPSSDRLNNVAMVQPVAAGHSPLYTAQVGHLQFEPLWSLLLAVASGFDPDRVLVLYAFVPLIIVAGVSLSLYAALRPLADSPDGAWSGWERALIAGTATLLMSAPLDFTGPYRVPWAMTFLLKPNHALGLVVAPWVARRVARIRGWRDRVAAAVLLHLLGWAFVIHMGAFCVGLVVFAVASVAFPREGRDRDPLDVAAVIGLNILVVSPYLVMLFTGYGVFQAGPRLQIPPGSPHLLEATTRMAPLFALGTWGALVAYRRDRMGRVWASQLAAAFGLWLSYFALHFLQQAKERDDSLYWLRFVMASCAAIGLWDLAARAAALAAGAASALRARLNRPQVRAAALALLLLPSALPYWYDPSRMDLYFGASLEPLPETIPSSIQALRDEAGRVGILAGDRSIARWAAALAGFRVMLAKDFHSPPDYSDRVQLERRLVRGVELEAAHATARRYGVTHFIVTRALLEEHAGASLGELERRADLRLVHLAGERQGDFVAVFALVAAAA